MTQCNICGQLCNYMEIGIRKYKKEKCQTANNWIDKADDIRRSLPIRLRKIENR